MMEDDDTFRDEEGRPCTRVWWLEDDDEVLFGVIVSPRGAVSVVRGEEDPRTIEADKLCGMLEAIIARLKWKGTT